MQIIQHLASRLTRVTVILAVAALGLLANPVGAQEKGAQQLMKLNRLNTVAEVQKVEAGDTIVMACPKCRDTWAMVVQPMGKGGRSETAAVQRHACPGCESKLATEGVGKQARQVVKHICKQCGSKNAFCCVIKKGSGPTPGMEESQPKSR
ncbi:MAG: hypothetical protein ACYDC1_03095 [Limisphaerales bacterium]